MMKNMQLLCKNTWMYNSPTKFVIVRPDISSGNSMFTSSLKMLKSFQCPVIYDACMNNVGLRCLKCLYKYVS